MFDCTEPDVIYCSKNLDVIEGAHKMWQKNAPIVTPGGKYPYISSDAIFNNAPDVFQPFTVESTKEHVASIMFTSGTTGTPKGIQIVDNMLKVYTRSPPRRLHVPDDYDSGILTLTDVMLTSPMFWVSNLITFSHSLYNANVLIIPKKGWTSKDALETVEKYRPGTWFTGHSVLLDLAHKPYVSDYDLSSLKTVVTGGTLLLANQRREINEKVFKNMLNIRHVYGSTEVGIISRWRDDININSDEYNSVGTLEKGVTLKIMDDSGKQLGPRQEGEIWVKTASMTPGYMTLNRQIKPAIDENGWYHIGDIGYYDEKKLLYVVGRLKDIMKFRGVQIAPAEIENVLNEHPDVLESCVVGKFDVIDGDIPVAFVVLKESSTTNEDDLFEFLNENLAEIKRPHEIRILNEIPKSAVGKQLRTKLEEMLK